MSNTIIVLNAGSSSLKFSIYGVADRDPNLVARGQVEGLGSSPRFKAKDQQGQVLAEAALNGSFQGFGQAPSVWVIPTDEEAVIASHTLAVVRLPVETPRSRASR